MQANLVRVQVVTVTSVSPVHAHPAAVDELARTWWAWALAHGTLAFGLVAAEVAIVESIDGAPTVGEQRLVDFGTASAVVLVPLGLGLARSLRRSPWSCSAWRARRAVGSAVGAIAAVLAVTRVPTLVSRLIWHVSVDADEPLTTLTLSLQVLVSVGITGALVSFAVAEHRGAAPPHLLRASMNQSPEPTRRTP